MDDSCEIIPAGQFKQKCLAIIDIVAKKHRPIIISKRGKPVARLIPFESEQEIEESILSTLRSGEGGILVDEAIFLRPTHDIAGWNDL